MCQKLSSTLHSKSTTFFIVVGVVVVVVFKFSYVTPAFVSLSFPSLFAILAFLTFSSFCLSEFSSFHRPL